MISIFNPAHRQSTNRSIRISPRCLRLVWAARPRRFRLLWGGANDNPSALVGTQKVTRTVIRLLHDSAGETHLLTGARFHAGL